MSVRLTPLTAAAWLALEALFAGAAIPAGRSCVLRSPPRHGDAASHGRSLEGAIAFARERGAEALEAYPVVVDAGEGIHTEAAFTGTLPMFERAGCTVATERASDPSASRKRVVVRRELG